MRRGLGVSAYGNKETVKGDKIIWQGQENCKAIWRYWNRLSETVQSATGSYIIMAGEICNTYLHRHLSCTYHMCSHEWSYTGLYRYKSKIWRACCRPVAQVESQCIMRLRPGEPECRKYTGRLQPVLESWLYGRHSARACVHTDPGSDHGKNMSGCSREVRTRFKNYAQRTQGS